MRSIATHLEGERRTYRFAVFGGTEAGKTCLLAALGMARASHPGGYTCGRHRLLPKVTRPAGPWQGWDVENDPVAAFYAGSEVIGEAEKALKGGGVPEATGVQPPLILLYEFTTPDRGSFWVE